MTYIPKVAAPRNVADATVLCERFATLEGEIALIDSARNDSIAACNNIADTAAEPLIAERDAIVAKLEPWWKRMAAKLTEGTKRKSIELGGCMIGTRSGRDSLAVAGDEDVIVKALEKKSWAKPLLKVAAKLDKVAILKTVDGVYKKQLAALGLTRKPGAETFLLARAEQEGTRK